MLQTTSLSSRRTITLPTSLPLLMFRVSKAEFCPEYQVISKPLDLKEPLSIKYVKDLALPLTTTTQNIGLMYLGISPRYRNGKRDESYPVYGF